MSSNECSCFADSKVTQRSVKRVFLHPYPSSTSGSMKFWAWPDFSKFWHYGKSVLLYTPSHLESILLSAIERHSFKSKVHAPVSSWPFPSFKAYTDKFNCIFPLFSPKWCTYGGKRVFLDLLIMESVSFKQFVNIQTPFKNNLEAKSYTTALQKQFCLQPFRLSIQY